MAPSNICTCLLRIKPLRRLFCWREFIALAQSSLNLTESCWPLPFIMLWLSISSWQLWVSRISWCVPESDNYKITHVWYRNNEPKSLVLPVVSIIILCIPSTALLIPHVESIPVAYALAFVTFITALLGSISLYRLSPFHPLAKYPGPTRCKLTKIWMAWITFGGRGHIYYKTLHDKYGPIVRVGESLFDIFDWKRF